MPPTIVELDAPDGAVDPQVPGAWPDPARRYLANVAEALDGIDAQERQDLLDDLRTHIDALLEVDSLDGRHPPLNLTILLGAPRDYAAELLASAGLQTGPARSARGWVGRRIEARRARLTAIRRMLRHPRVQAARQWLAQLEPAWWVARGLGLAIALGVITGGGMQLPVPRVLGSPVVGLLAIVGLVYGSVEVGVGRRVPAGRAWSVALRVSSLVAVFALLATLGSVRGVDNPDQFTVDDELYQELDYYRNQLGAFGSGLTLPGGEVVTNIYPYDRDGQPLDGVLLYDGVGNPLVLQPYPEGYGAPFADYGLQTDFAADATGALVPNLYPLSQYRTGGQGVDGGLVGVDHPPGAQTQQTPSVRPRPEVAVPPGLDG